MGQRRQGVDGIWETFQAVAAEVEIGQGLVVSDDVGYL